MGGPRASNIAILGQGRALTPEEIRGFEGDELNEVPFTPTDSETGNKYLTLERDLNGDGKKEKISVLFQKNTKSLCIGNDTMLCQRFDNLDDVRSAFVTDVNGDGTKDLVVQYNLTGGFLAFGANVLTPKSTPAPLERAVQRPTQPKVEHKVLAPTHAPAQPTVAPIPAPAPKPAPAQIPDTRTVTPERSRGGATVYPQVYVSDKPGTITINAPLGGVANYVSVYVPAGYEVTSDQRFVFKGWERRIFADKGEIDLRRYELYEINAGFKDMIPYTVKIQKIKPSDSSDPVVPDGPVQVIINIIQQAGH